MQDLVIQLYLPKLHADRASGRNILRTIIRYLPELAPEYYNSFEPVNLKFDDRNIESALDCWGSSFLWKRKKPAIWGNAGIGSSHPRRPFHSSLSIHAKPEHVKSDKLAGFVQAFAGTFKPDLAVVHVFTKPELESKRTFYLSSFIMRENLPNLYWLTVFGAPYVALFGRERLLSTPAAKAQALGGECISIQLTEDLMDCRREPDRVEAARTLAKRHLNSNAFFDPQLNPNHLYATPTFVIED